MFFKKILNATRKRPIMHCPICSEKMAGMFNTAELPVLKCKNCSFIGLDLESWQYPYSDKDYYSYINEADINPERPFILQRIDFVKKYVRGGDLLSSAVGWERPQLRFLTPVLMSMELKNQ